MPNIGPMEIIVVLVIALIVLGPKRLPEAGKSLGKGLREFKDTVSGITGGDDDKVEHREVQAAAPVPVAPAAVVADAAPEPAATASPAPATAEPASATPPERVS
jgi:sec-independent protein translocase protein TatA